MEKTAMLEPRQVRIALDVFFYLYAVRVDRRVIYWF
ncbi:MAG: hypothetical protein DDT30_00720 [Dehalococcoidia bacterium]|nr:hypothetical protein [Bacillota bacterium]MBT9142976.1 hypothetical protein [Bacillota bacterium]